MAQLTFNQTDGPYLGADVTVGSWNVGGNTLRAADPIPSGDARILWESASDGTVSVDVTRTLESGSYIGVIFRAIDENNYYAFINRGNDNRCRLIRIVNGSNAGDIFDVTPSTITNHASARTLSVQFSGNSAQCFQDSAPVGPSFTIANEGATLVGLRSGNTDFWVDNLSFNDAQAVDPNPDPVQPLPTLPLPQVLSGFKRRINKLGKIFDKPTSMPDNEEFWVRVYETKNIPGFPSDQYPWIAYSSSDHSSGQGGIYVRVWRKDDGLPTNGGAWYEWQEVSNESVFDHITQKTNPIYKLAVQTETPQMIVDDGLVYLFTHDGSVSVDPDYGGSVQATTYATGANGIDFTHQGVINAYNPKLFSGDGHGGYFDVGLNKNPAIPFKWIAKQTKGGGLDSRGPSVRIVGSDTLGARYWTEIADFGRMQGQLQQYNPAGKEDWIYIPENPHNQIREGAYWKIKGTFRPNVVSGGADEGAVPCELLVDDYFNVVGAPNIMGELGAAGEFDDAEMQNFHELEYEGVVYGFYKAMQSGVATSSIGICTVEREAANWEIFNPLSSRSQLQSYSSDGVNLPTGLTVTPSISNYDLEGINCVSLLLEMDESESALISTQGVIPEDHDIIDVIFKNIGKDTSDAMLVEFGLTDSLTNPTIQFNYRWNPRATATTSTARSEKMVIDTLGTSSDGATLSRNYFGQSGGRNSDRNSDEASQARHNVGLRIIPANGELIVLEGVAGQEIIDISGFDYTKSLYVFIKAKLDSSQGANPATADAAVTFEKIDLISYSAEAVAVPQAPTVTTSKSTDSITITTNNVSGAAGYKYFLDNQQNETGTFTGLEPETTYTVYARASNALGDSAPSTIQTVTTDAAIPVNQPPTANAGPDQSVAAATQFTLDGTGSQDSDGTIIEWRWTQTAGDTVTLNLEDPARPTATSPSKTTSQRLTFQLITVDDEGAESSPGTVNIDVAAFSVGEMLKLLDTRQWTVVNDGSVQAFEGRSNREAFRFLVTPSDGIQTSAEGYFMFDQPGVHAVEVISTPTSKISSVDDPHMIRGDVIAARIGDLKTDENGQLVLTFVLYVTDDKDGLVMTAKVIEPFQKASYFRKQG